MPTSPVGSSHHGGEIEVLERQRMLSEAALHGGLTICKSLLFSSINNSSERLNLLLEYTYCVFCHKISSSTLSLVKFELHVWTHFFSDILVNKDMGSRVMLL